MKKSIFALATAVACMFAFSACTPEDEAQLQQLANDALDNEALGSIYLVPSNLQPGSWAQQNHPSVVAGDTLWFNSAMCDTTFSYDGLNVNPGVLFLGGNIQTNPAHVNFPLLGINLRDDTHEDYPVTNVTGDFSFVTSLDTNNWRYYLTHNDIQYGNMMVLAVSENDYYICYDGNIHIDTFSAVGTIISGRIENVQAFYVTKQQLQGLLLLDENMRTYLYALLPHVTFNGAIQSRRTVWVREVVNELENAQ